MENTGHQWPQRRASVNLAPADVRKDGTAFDLPIALAIIGASGGLDSPRAVDMDSYLVAGELSLDGYMRPVRGVLSMAMLARESGMRGVMVPSANAAEASLVRGLEVIAVTSLDEAVRFFRDGDASFRVGPGSAETLLSDRNYPFDMSDVAGQESAKRALEVAAAGGHNVLLVGPPGSGKTMLSKRMLTILPEMAFEEALETTKIYSVTGLVNGNGLVSQRPFRCPHHTISDVGLVGGGSGIPRPGEISLAHNGILFLDELPEFRKQVLEVMRQPLEDGQVSISRSLVTVTYPANIMLVGSMNPCPCGYEGDPRHACTDTPQAIANYRNRLSGPLLDRIDIHVDVPSVPYKELREGDRGESSDDVRARVNQARSVQRERLHQAGLHCNAQMGAREIRTYCPVDDEGHQSWNAWSTSSA